MNGSVIPDRAREQASWTMVFRASARQEPVGLDPRQVEEAKEDGGGHDDAFLKVHPGAMRHLQGIGDGGNALVSEEVPPYLGNPVGEMPQGCLISPPGAVTVGGE